MTAREEERRRLRRDLHDGLGPTLGGLTLGLDAARSSLIQDPKTADAVLSELKSQTRDAVADIRRVVHGLRPPALDDLGLVAAIQQQAARHGTLSGDTPGAPGHTNGPVFSMAAPEDDGLPPLPAAVEVACYRIAQEAITNVSRHAGARNCWVRVSPDAHASVVYLEATDDGAGIPEDRRAGVGLTSMRERVEELGGTLAVEAIPGGGTRVLTRLPLQAAGSRDQEEAKCWKNGNWDADTMSAKFHDNLIPDTSNIRVLIVDDHTLFRYGMRAMFTSTPGYEVVGEAADGEEAVRMAAELSPDVVLMDLQMPGMNGIEATRRIAASSPAVAVVVVTMLGDDDSVFAAMRAGARGYVLKGADGEEVLEVVGAVVRGEAHFGPEIAARIMGFFSATRSVSPSEAFPDLTAREAEILDLIARGMSNGDIARRLHLSAKTVRNHVSNVFLKLQVADRSQAIVRAREAGLGHDGS